MQSIIEVSSWDRVDKKVRRRKTHLYTTSEKDGSQLLSALDPYKAVRGKVSPFLPFMQASHPKVTCSEDLQGLGDLDYDALVMKLVTEVLGFDVSFAPQTARQYAAAETIFVHFGTIFTSGYDTEFSTPIQLEEEVADTDATYFVAAIGVAASRQYLAVPSAVRERLGFEDVRLSLAARKRAESIEPDAAPPHITLINKEQECLDLGLNFEALSKLRHDPDLKTRLEGSYPYRLFAHGIALHSQAVSSETPFSIRAWLKEQCHGPFRPAWLPACVHTEADPVMWIGRNKGYHFATFELFLEARSRLLEVLRNSQETRGPEWVLNNKQEILDEWFSKYYAEVELPTLPDWKEVEGRPELTRQIAEKRLSAKGGSPDQLAHCLTTSIALHPPDALFARKELINNAACDTTYTQHCATQCQRRRSTTRSSKTTIADEGGSSPSRPRWP